MTSVRFINSTGKLIAEFHSRQSTTSSVASDPDQDEKQDNIDGFKTQVPTSLTARVITGRKLGSGGMADVYIATWATATIAVKELKLALCFGYPMQHFYQEAIKMRALNDFSLSCAPKFLGYYADEERDCYQILMTYIPGESLASKLDHQGGRFDKPEALTVLKAVTASCTEIAAHKLVHGDLKSLNIILNEQGKAVVLDWSFSVYLGIETSRGAMFGGTAGYHAPELITKEEYSLATDVYAFGSLFFDIVMGYEPFHSESNRETITTAVESGKREPIPSNCDPAFAELIRKAWLQAPEERPTMQALHEVFSAMENKTATLSNK
jgi:serine/threonine-protein kinase